MGNEIFELYNRCFPDYQTTAEWFVNLLEPSKAHVIETRDDGDNIMSFSMIHRNSISLLCVDKAYRAKGYGTSLLYQSEEFIRGNGA